MPALCFHGTVLEIKHTCMDLKELQQIVDKWVSNPEFTVKYFPPFQCLAQLSEEVGEVARELSHLYGHKKKKVGEETDGLEVEIGDVLFSLICLANSQNIDLTQAFQKSMDKKTVRDAERFKKKGRKK